MSESNTPNATPTTVAADAVRILYCRCAYAQVVPPAVKDAEAGTLFPKGFRTVKPYLRYTPQPNK